MAYFTMNGYDSYSGCDIIVTASVPLKTEEGEDIYFTLGSLQTLSVSTHQDKRPVRSLGNINAKDYVMGQRTIAGSLVFAVFDRHFADRIMRSAGVLMADEIPALNLTINFANEYGRSSRMAIYGVKLINEGQVMSINDLYTENTYQFVALGMEPLSADMVEGSVQTSNKQNKPTGGVITPNIQPLDKVDSKEFEESSGKVISDKIKNNFDDANKINVALSVSVEQPIEGEETGIATLTLNPMQQEGCIYITNLTSNEVEHTITVNGSLSYNLELPVGFYNAKYMNTMRTVESNIVKIIVKVLEQSYIGNVSKMTTSYPIIENITNDTLSVSLYNKEYDSIICYASGDKEMTLENNNIVTFKNLRPDTEYNIYGANEHSESNMITVKTLPDRMTYYNKFIEYLASNRGILQNDYNALVNELNTLLVDDEWPYDNIIDGVSMLNNSLLKQELLLYAMCFENSMLEAYNYQNPYKLNIVRNNVFDSNLSVDNWESTKYYSKSDNKNKLEGIVSNNEVFNAYPNKAYSIYGIDDSNSSIKQYVSVFSSEGKEFLSKYKEVDKYKLLDTTFNRDLYPMLNTEELYAVTIRDNFLCDKQMLDEPYIYIDENGKIHADVAYDDKILLDDVYYLCVSEMYSTLDEVPKRKEPFNRQIKDLDLSEAYIPFDSDKVYHFWIENSQGAKISRPFIFNYKQSVGLETVMNKELLTYLKSKKLTLSGKIDNVALDDIVYSLYSAEVPKKDLDTRFEYAILEYGLHSKYVSNALKECLYEAVIMNASSRLNVNRTHSATIYKDTKQFRIKSSIDLETKIVTKSYMLESQEVVCDIYGSDAIINFKGDYMSIYLINDYSDKILAVLVLDCARCDYKALGFNIKVGDK